jgi:hypothetical protein
LPPVLVALNTVPPPLLFITVALPAVLVLSNRVNPLPLLLIVALPAALAFWKTKVPLPAVEKVDTFDELLTMPTLVIVTA